MIDSLWEMFLEDRMRAKMISSHAQYCSSFIDISKHELKEFGNIVHQRMSETSEKIFWVG